MLILISFVLLACINPIYKYGHAWVILLVLWGFCWFYGGQNYEIYGCEAKVGSLLACEVITVLLAVSLVMLMLFLILRGYCWSCEVIVGLRMIFTMVFRIKLCLPLTGGGTYCFWFCRRLRRMRRRLCDSVLNFIFKLEPCIDHIKISDE